LWYFLLGPGKAADVPDTAIAIQTPTPAPGAGGAWEIQGAIVNKAKPLFGARIDIVVTSVQGGTGGGGGGGPGRTCKDQGGFCATASECRMAGGAMVGAIDCPCCIVVRALAATPPGTVIGSVTSDIDGLFQVSGTVPAAWAGATIAVQASYAGDPAQGIKPGASNAIAFVVPVTGGGGGPVPVTIQGYATDYASGQRLANQEVRFTHPTTNAVYKAFSDASGDWAVDLPPSVNYRINALRSGYQPFERFLDFLSGGFIGATPSMTPVSVLPPQQQWEFLGAVPSIAGDVSTHPIGRRVKRIQVRAVAGFGHNCVWKGATLRCACKLDLTLYRRNPSTGKDEVSGGPYRSDWWAEPPTGYYPDNINGWRFDVPGSPEASSWVIAAVHEGKSCGYWDGRDCVANFAGPGVVDPVVLFTFETTLAPEDGREPAQNPADGFGLYTDFGDGSAYKWDATTKTWNPAPFPIGLASSFSPAYAGPGGEVVAGGGGPWLQKPVGYDGYGGIGPPVPVVLDISLDDVAEEFDLSRVEVIAEIGGARIVAHPVVGPDYAVWRAAFAGISQGPNEALVTVDGETSEARPRTIHCDRVVRLDVGRDLRNVHVPMMRDTCRYVGEGPMPRQNCACQRNKPPTGPKESAEPDEAAFLRYLASKGIEPTPENIRVQWMLLYGQRAPSGLMQRFARNGMPGAIPARQVPYAPSAPIMPAPIRQVPYTY
jgi:hypothetical protein